jgi:hypothetical protein
MYRWCVAKRHGFGTGFSDVTVFNGLRGASTSTPRPVPPDARAPGWREPGPASAAVKVGYVSSIWQAPVSSRMRRTAGLVAEATRRPVPTAVAWRWARISALTPAQSQNVVPVASATTTAVPPSRARVRASWTSLALVRSISPGSATTADCRTGCGVAACAAAGWPGQPPSSRSGEGSFGLKGTVIGVFSEVERPVGLATRVTPAPATCQQKRERNFVCLISC